MERSPGPSASGHSDSESDSSCLAPPARKKTKRDSKWQDDWKKYHMKQSKKGVSFARCNICSSDFSIASGGVNQVKRHVMTKKHSDLARVLVRLEDEVGVMLNRSKSC